MRFQAYIAAAAGAFVAAFVVAVWRDVGSDELAALAVAATVGAMLGSYSYEWWRNGRRSL